MRRTLSVLAATASVLCLYGVEASAQATMSAIANKMTGVVVDLARAETGDPVQRHEKAVLRDLDELIASLEKECQACRNGMKRNNPRTGMPDSTISRGTGGIGSLVDPQESQKDWAKLSDRERDRILQSMSEGFPPEYRQVLERYYRRLAEEKTAASGTEAAQPRDAASPAGKP